MVRTIMLYVTSCHNVEVTVTSDLIPSIRMLRIFYICCLFNARHGQNINLPVRVRHTFMSTRLQAKPLNGFLQLVA